LGISSGTYSYIGAPATFTYTPGTGAVSYTMSLLPGAYNYSGAPMDFSAPMPVASVVPQGGHGSSYDDELELYQRKQTRIAIEARKRRKQLEEEIAQVKEEIAELAEEKREVVAESQQQVQLFKAEFKQSLPESEYQGNLEVIRQDYRQQKAVIAAKEKQQKELLIQLQKEQIRAQIEEVRAREAEQKAEEETTALIKRLRRRRNEEETLLITMGMI
jgi:hypothetical protein